MSIKTMIVEKGFRLGGKISKHGPEILLTGGLVGMVATTVLTARATQKAAPEFDIMRQDIKDIEERRTNETLSEYSAKAYADDMIIAVKRQIGPVVKPYILPVAIGSLSIGAIIWSHRIMSSRNIALTAAYAVLNESYNKYRDRVREEFGDAVDKTILATERDETDNKKENRDGTISRRVPGDLVSPYSVWFDENNPNYTNDPGLNLNFLRTQQTYFNDRLRAKGHVFLNEVYENLGFNHTSAGAVTGWVYDSDEGDNFIDFGIYDGNVQVNKDFLAGYEKQVLLDFNVDGVIWNLI